MSFVNTTWNFQAYKELGLLLVLIVVAILVYSSLVYFAERDRDEVIGINCTNWQESAKLVRLGLT